MSHEHALLAVDPADDNTRLFERANELQRQGIQMDVVQALDPFDLYYRLEPGLGRMTQAFEQEVIDSIRERLLDAVAPLGVAQERVHLVQGHKASTIVEQASELGCDLIVIGSHGRHGLDRLLGSVSYGVVHHAGCDVLLVHTGSHQS